MVAGRLIVRVLVLGVAVWCYCLSSGAAYSHKRLFLLQQLQFNEWNCVLCQRRGSLGEYNGTEQRANEEDLHPTTCYHDDDNVTKKFSGGFMN